MELRARGDGSSLKAAAGRERCRGARTGAHLGERPMLQLRAQRCARRQGPSPTATPGPSFSNPPRVKPARLLITPAEGGACCKVRPTWIIDEVGGPAHAYIQPALPLRPAAAASNPCTAPAMQLQHCSKLAGGANPLGASDHTASERSKRSSCVRRSLHIATAQAPPQPQATRRRS